MSANRAPDYRHMRQSCSEGTHCPLRPGDASVELHASYLPHENAHFARPQTLEHNTHAPCPLSPQKRQWSHQHSRTAKSHP
eukprot:992691-Pelagomonas_calceolata.AAC.1